MFVRLVCNYLPTAHWFHLALGLIFIGLHNVWQPLVTEHSLFGIQEKVWQREGKRDRNSESSKRISVILRGESLGNFLKAKLKGFWKWNSEMKARFSRHTSHKGPNYGWRHHCFPRPNRLAVNEGLARYYGIHSSGPSPHFNRMWYLSGGSRVNTE